MSTNGKIPSCYVSRVCASALALLITAGCGRAGRQEPIGHSVYIVHAACLADNAATLICQSPPKLLYGKIEKRVPGAPIQGGTSNNEYGKPLPAMRGQIDYYGPDQNGVQRNVTLVVKTRAGHRVGQGFSGSVDLLSTPKVYNSASGHFKSSSEFVIDNLWFDVNRSQRAPIPSDGISVPIGPQ